MSSHSAGFRIDRALRELLTRGGLLDDTAPRILNYHSVGVDGGYDNISVQTFRAQLELLTDRYDVVPLDRVFASGDRKRIAITFDDGLRSFLRAARPILHEFDAPATVFLIGGVLEDPRPMSTTELRERRLRTPDPLMDREELRTLVDDPLVTIGAHTRTHPDLTEVDSTNELEDEIAGARDVIEDALGIDINQFAYPYNAWDARSREIVQRTYDLGVQGDGERAIISELTDRHRLPRLSGCLPSAQLPHALSDFAVYYRISMREMFTRP